MTTNNTTKNDDNMPKQEEDATSQGLWQTFKSELFNGSFFPAAETSSTNDQGGLDDNKEDAKPMNDHQMIQDAFFPSGVKVLCFKLLLRGWAISAFYLNLSTSTAPYFEMAFLTNWSLVVTMIYMTLSLLASFAATCGLSWATVTSEPHSNNFFVRALSIFFPLAAVSELVVVFYWAHPVLPEGQDSFPYSSIVAHGPLAPLILLDGLLLNAIPIRARQITGIWAFQCTYILWTMIYAIVDLMNPITMTMDMDEAIYEGFLNWRLYPGKTLLGAATILFVATPLYFGLVWTLSFYTRKLRQSSRTKKATTTLAGLSMDGTHHMHDDADLEAGSHRHYYYDDDEDVDLEAVGIHRRKSIHRVSVTLVTESDGQIVTEYTV